METVEVWAQGVEKDIELRRSLASQLPEIVPLASSRPFEVYKILKYLCTLGPQVQDSIRSLNISLTPPSAATEQFIQFLNNFSVSNPQNQRLVWPVSTQLTISTEKQLQLYLTLLSTLVAGDRSRGDWFTATDEGKAFFSFLLTKIEVMDDRTFEWAFLLIRNVLPGRLRETLTEARDRGQEVVLLNYVDSLVLKDWETGNGTTGSPMKSLFSLQEPDLTYLISLLLSTPKSSPLFPLLFSTLEASSRSTPSLQPLYLSAGLIAFAWKTLAELVNEAGSEALVGLKTVILQLLCNNLQGNSDAAEAALENFYVMLSCTRIDPENLYMREWAVLMIKLVVEMRPEARDRIAALELMGVSEEAKRLKIDLDAKTLKPRYQR